MVKDTPNTALENMNRYITKMPYAIEALEIKLKTLSSPSKELQDKVQSLRIGLENVYKSSSNDEKIANYGKLKQAITNVNAELLKLKGIKRAATKVPLGEYIWSSQKVRMILSN